LLFEHMKVANPVPNLCSFRTFGEAGYVHQPVQRRVQSAKFEPRSVKMYFVGREGSRIYLMWDPVTQSIHRTSSVAWPKHDVKAVVQEDTATTKPDQCFYIQDPPPALDPSSFPHHEVSLPEQGSGYVFDGLEAEAQSSFDFDADIDNYNSLTEVANARATPQREATATHQRQDTSQNAPRHNEIGASFDARNIFNGRRRITRPPNRYAAISPCFATAITEATTTDSPPEPTTRKAARLHPYSKQWIVAQDTYICSEIKEITVTAIKHRLRICFGPAHGPKINTPQSMYHNVYRVVLKQGEVWAIDVTGAQFGYYKPLCSWESFQQRISKVDRVNDLGHIRHTVFYRPTKYPDKFMVSQQAEKEVLVKALEHWLSEWVTLHNGKFNTILHGPEAAWESTKHEFLEELSAHVKKSLTIMYTPAEIAKRATEVEARMDQNQADPTSRDEFEGFLKFVTSAMGNPSP
ncbi:NAD-binding Rossmann fold oxidoreductase family protein, partial [Pyrenophora tritici-repentis]